MLGGVVVNLVVHEKVDHVAVQRAPSIAVGLLDHPNAPANALPAVEQRAADERLLCDSSRFIHVTAAL